MRRIATALAGAALFIGLVTQPAPASAAVPGYDSAYAGESAFLTLAPGQSGSLTVFFLNTGTSVWVRGTGSQVDLAACLQDKLTCNAQDASDSAFNSGWLSATRYAAQTQSSVAPGQVGTFTYNVAVPVGQASGTYRLNGALVLSSTGADIHNEGYYQDVMVSVSDPPPTITNIQPLSGSTGGGTGMTITGSGFVCAPSVPTVSFGGTLGTTTSCTATSVLVTTPAHAAGTVDVTVSNVGSVPSNVVSFTYIDTAAPQLTSITALGRSLTLTFDKQVCLTGQMLVGDVKYSVNGGAQQDPSNVGGAITTSGAPTCSPNPPSGPSQSGVGSTAVTVFAQSAFVNTDQVVITLFNTSRRMVDRSGNIASSSTRSASASADTTAPAISKAVADSATTIRVTLWEPVYCNNAEPGQFTAVPAGGSVLSAVALSCDLGLSGGSGGSTTVTVTFFSAISTNQAGGTLSYAQSGTSANRIKDMAGNDASSPQNASYAGYTPQAPTMVDARLTTNAGFSSQLDAGDVFKVAFSKKMSTTETLEIKLRVRDGDGTTADVTCSPDASCSWNAGSATLGSVSYDINRLLTVTIVTTTVPIAGFAGTTPGLQFPLTIVDTAHLTDEGGLGVDAAGSADAIIDLEN